MRIEIRGLAKINKAAKDIKAAPQVIKNLLLKQVHRFANESVANVKEKYLSGPRPEKLGTVTGRLRSSIRYLISDAQKKQINVRFGSDIIYAPVHEFGDEKRGIRKRSFLQPGVEEMIPDMQERIEAMLEEVVSRGFGGQ